MNRKLILTATLSGLISAAALFLFHAFAIMFTGVISVILQFLFLAALNVITLMISSKRVQLNYKTAFFTGFISSSLALFIITALFITIDIMSSTYWEADASLIIVLLLLFVISAAISAITAIFFRENNNTRDNANTPLDSLNE